jgi:acetolactate synthase-1/2/3 large subunit
MSAGFMACAGAEVSGTPGVLLVGNGPGLASSVDAVAHAWLDRVPLIVVSDRYTDAEAQTTGHQILDQQALLAPVVKLSARLEASTATGLLEKAFATALAPRQGPVHLDLPRDQGVARISSETAEPSMLHPDELNEASTTEALRSIATRWEASQRPVILVGLEANKSVEPGSLVRLAAHANAAVFTTYKAKGVYPEDDARWAGIFTGGEMERALAASADVILSVGLDPVELLPRPWGYGSTVLSLRTAWDTADPTHPDKVWVGDLGVAIELLCESTSGEPRAGIPETEVIAFRENTLAKLRLDQETLLPSWRAAEAIASALPRDALVAVDAGAHMFPATMFIRPSGPRRFSISNGLATMGYAIPAAIGAALARPGSPVVALTGDGGTAYGLSEIETSIRAGVKLIVIVFNDSSLSLIRIKHEANGYNRAPLDFGPIDFAAVARGLGAVGATATTRQELDSALAAAIAYDGTSLIDVRVTGDEYARTLAAIRG